MTNRPAQGRLRDRAAQRAGVNLPATRPGSQVDAQVAQVAGEVPDTVRNLIEGMAPEISRTLPKHIGVERMTRVALTLMRQTPDLQKCSPASFIGALLTCSQLGVEPGPLGHAYIVPYWNNRLKCKEATFILGYKGMIDLARRSDRLKSISAHTIYSKEVEQGRFRVTYGSDQRIDHDPIIFEERGHPVGYYAIAELASGEKPFVVLSKTEVDEFRRRSATQKAEASGPWNTDYQAMAWKTCVRRLGTWLPQSVEFAAAVGSEESVRLVGSAGDVFDIRDAPPPAYDDDPDGYDTVAGELEETEQGPVDTRTGEVADDTAGWPVEEPPGWDQ